MVTEQMHCPRCGAAVAPDAQFCPNCGQKLGHVRTRRGHLLGITLLVVAIVLAVAGGLGVRYFSATRQQSRIETAIRQADEDALEDLVVDENGREMPDDNIEALVHLLDNYPETRTTLINQLRGGSREVQLVQSGRHALVLPAYKMQLMPQNVTVQAADADTQYYLDDDLVGRGKTLDLPVGQYSLRVVRRLSGRTDTATHQLIVPVTGSAMLSLTRDAVTTSAAAVAQQNSNANTTAAAIIAKYKPNVDARNDQRDASPIIGDWEIGDSSFELKANGRYELDREHAADEEGTYELVYRSGNQFNIAFTRSDGEQTVHAFIQYDDHLINAETKEYWKKDN